MGARPFSRKAAEWPCANQANKMPAPVQSENRPSTGKLLHCRSSHLSFRVQAQGQLPKPVYQSGHNQCAEPLSNRENLTGSLVNTREFYNPLLTNELRG